MLLLLGLPVRAADPMIKLVDQLEQALNEENDGKTHGEEDYAPAFQITTFRIRTILSQRSDYSSAVAAIETLLANTTSKKVSILCRELLANIERERQLREHAFVPEANLAVAHASKIALTAKTSGDLDAIFKQLTDLKQRRTDAVSEAGKRTITKVEAALQLVTRWQVYLAKLNSGNVKAAHDALQPLVDTAVYPVIARSEILTRVTALEPRPTPRPEQALVERVVDNIQLLDEIAPALQKLNSMGVGSGDDHTGFALYRSLKQIEDLYKDYCTGLPVVINVRDAFTFQTHNRVSRLWGQLLLLTLPRYFDAPDRVARHGESLADYLSRLRFEARSEGNLGLLARVMEAYRALDSANSGRAWADLQSVRRCLVARNQEEAGEYALAVTSYEYALRDAGENTPVKFIGERLKEIKTEHAVEYEQGVKRFLGPGPSTPDQSMPPTDTWGGAPSLLTIPGPPQQSTSTPTATPVISLQPTTMTPGMSFNVEPGPTFPPQSVPPRRAPNPD